MSNHRNEIILESLYQKYIDLGYEDAEAQELAAKEFEENSNQVYINCRGIGETMTEHTHKVIRQDKINRLAKWRKGIKYILGEKKSDALIPDSLGLPVKISDPFLMPVALFFFWQVPAFLIGSG